MICELKHVQSITYFSRYWHSYGRAREMIRA